MAPDPLIFAVSLALGLGTGLILHRSDYCIAGMFRDLFLFRKTFMLRTLFLLVVASMVLFEAGRLAGLLRPYPFPLIGTPSLTNVIGGFIFGAGMVLAGGCVVGTLYKAGAGRVTSMAAFAGLLAGSVLYAEFHPWWAAFRGKTTFFHGNATLPQLLGLSPAPLVALVAVPSALVLYRWWRRGGLERTAGPEHYLQPWKAALLLPLVGFVSYLVIGMPMGITTAYSKWGALVERGLFPGHVDGLAYLQALPLDYVHPLSGARLLGGAGPRWDAIALIQYPLIAGIVLGSLLSAASIREFHIYYRIPPRQIVSGLAGGLLMGAASRMAPSCNVWHLLGGVPILALQSLFFAGGLVPGAWLGSRLLQKFVLTRPAAAGG